MSPLAKLLVKTAQRNQRLHLGKAPFTTIGTPRPFLQKMSQVTSEVFHNGYNALL